MVDPLKIFAVTSYGAHTPLTGGRLRRDNIFAAVARRGHVVDRLDIPARPGPRSALAAARLTTTGRARRCAHQADVVLLGDVFCVPMLPMLSKIGTPVLVDLVDSPYRLVDAAPRGTLRQRTAAAMQKVQLRPVMHLLLAMADGVTYISADDEKYDGARVPNRPPAYIVPNGINPMLTEMPLTTPPAEGYIAWLADWNYPPNRESFAWFASQVAPHLPDAVLARVRLFGAGDPRGAQLGNGADDRVRHLVSHAGFVNPITEVYKGARCILAPVIRGAGLNNKVLEPLAAGRPVLTTTVGIRGLSRELVRHVVVAQNGKALADELAAVLESRPTVEGASTARADVSSLSWEAAGGGMEAALLATIGRIRRRARMAQKYDSGTGSR